MRTEGVAVFCNNVAGCKRDTIGYWPTICLKWMPKCVFVISMELGEWLVIKIQNTVLHIA